MKILILALVLPWSCFSKHRPHFINGGLEYTSNTSCNEFLSEPPLLSIYNFLLKEGNSAESISKYYKILIKKETLERNLSQVVGEYSYKQQIQLADKYLRNFCVFSDFYKNSEVTQPSLESARAFYKKFFVEKFFDLSSFLYFKRKFFNPVEQQVDLVSFYKQSRGNNVDKVDPYFIIPLLTYSSGPYSSIVIDGAVHDLIRVRESYVTYLKRGSDSIVDEIEFHFEVFEAEIERRKITFIQMRTSEF